MGAGIKPLYPQGTNSTMFTECCSVAICDDEANCPKCGERVIGWDAKTRHDRAMIRWRDATRRWKHEERGK